MNLDITVTSTRNENYVEFSLNQDLIPPGTGLSFANPESAESHPLAKALFGIRGVKSVWILGNGIHVTKNENIRWSILQSKVLEAIRTSLNSGK